MKAAKSSGLPPPISLPGPVIFPRGSAPAFLELLEQERNEEAAQMLREHLAATLRNMQKITRILKP